MPGPTIFYGQQSAAYAPNLAFAAIGRLGSVARPLTGRGTHAPRTVMDVEDGQLDGGQGTSTTGPLRSRCARTDLCLT